MLWTETSFGYFSSVFHPSYLREFFFFFLKGMLQVPFHISKWKKKDLFLSFLSGHVKTLGFGACLHIWLKDWFNTFTVLILDSTNCPEQILFTWQVCVLSWFPRRPWLGMFIELCFRAFFKHSKMTWACVL